MRISESWLREWVDPPLSLNQIAERLTQAGLELEEMHAGPSLPDEIVVASVLKVNKHPQADRLTVCEVTDGTQTYSIVCGAANTRPNMKAVLAKVDTRMPDGTRIKEARIRGAKSQGMLCSERELGLGKDADGIMELPATTKPGMPLMEYLGPPEAVMELEITPNRGDCLSVLGVAREVSALCDLPLTNPHGKISLKPDHKRHLPIELLAPSDCPRYLGCIIEGIDLTKPSPDWMRKRLVAAGLRPLELAVDITNYVMLELGQPLHAFDLDKIEGGIRVRRGDGKQKLTLLNGDTLTPDPDDLVIADHARPLALAGIIGGSDSAIRADTRTIFLESAFFAPHAILGKQKKYALDTQAAYRFERGVDYEMPLRAIRRALALLKQYGGGETGEIAEAVDRQHLPNPRALTVHPARLRTFLGYDDDNGPTERQMKHIFAALGMQLSERTESAQDAQVRWKITPPSYRFDLDCWEGYAEEIGRVHGYDKIPVRVPKATLTDQSTASPLQTEDEIRTLLAARGYHEVINYSFIGGDDIRLSPSAGNPIPIVNPLSQTMTMMRCDLLPGLLRCLLYNHRQRKRSSKVFEFGMCFIPAEGKEFCRQEVRLGGAILDLPEGRPLGERAYDFYAVKSDLQALLAVRAPSQPMVLTTEGGEPAPSTIHPGRCLFITDGRNKRLGYAGQIHPELHARYKLGKAQAYVFELLTASLNMDTFGTYKPFARYPIAQFELALVMDRSLNYGQLKQQIRQCVGEHLQEIELLDIYTSPKLGADKKSMALRMIWQSPKETLTDDYVNAQMRRLLERLAKQNIHLRAE